MRKRFVAFILIVTIVANMTNIESVFAREKIDYYQILVDNGCSTLILDELTYDELKELGQQALLNPNEPVFKTTYTEIDNLEELQDVASVSEKDLIEAGATEEEVKEIEDVIDFIEESSVEEIAETYKVDEYGAELMKEAIKEEAKKNAKEQDVETSGSISTSKMGVAIIFTIDQSNPKEQIYKNKYRLTTIWAWSSPPAVQLFDDELAFAWKGGFSHKNGPADVNYNHTEYYYITPRYYVWNETYAETSPSYLYWVESIPDFGGYYRIKKCTPNFKKGSNYFKSGRVCFYLWKKSKNTYKNQCSVICNYIHNTISFTGAVISSGPSISIGTGQYKSDSQGKTTIYY